MKQGIIRIIVFVQCFISTICTWAIDVTIDNISYTLNLSERTASVIGSTLVHVVVPEVIQQDGVTYKVISIEAGAFGGNKIIKSIKTGNTIKSIKTGSYSYYYRYFGDAQSLGSFDGASNLEEADFGENLTEIGGGAFWGCSKLKKINVGSKLGKIGDSAFYGCTSLKYIVLPASIYSITKNLKEAYKHYETFYGITQLSIICLSQNFDTGYPDQTIYPSSSITFNNNLFVYTGNVPNVDYNFKGIGNGFQLISFKGENLQKNVGTYSTSIPFTFANEDMSFDVNIPFRYSITPVRLTAKVNNASRQYGNEDPQFTTTYTGFVNNEDASVITNDGSYSTMATAKSDVGTYVITQIGATAQNYEFEYEEGILTITKAPLIITANDKTITYGDSLPTLDAKFEGLKNNETMPSWVNEPQFSTTASSTSYVGTYPITISNVEAKNYDLTIKSGSLIIEKAELTVKADNKSKLYFEAIPELTISYTGLKNNETMPEWEKEPSVETSATIQSDAGEYTIHIKDGVAVNYNVVTQDGILTINKAQLKVTPQNATRLYGDENPSFSYSFSGFVNGEDESVIITKPYISTTAIKTSNVGEYTITSRDGSAKNYEFVYESGVLTITKAPLSVKVKDATKTYGSANPAFTFEYYGLKNGESSPYWTKSPVFITDANKSSGVGKYEVKAADGILSNYEIGEIAEGTLSVAPAPLTIKANDIVKQYYSDNPTLSYTCKGFVNGEDESVLTNKPILSTSATQTSKVGTYEINLSETSSPNYSISYVNGTLNITPRILTVSVGYYERAYNEENPEFEVKYDGFVGNEDEKVLITKASASTTATKTSDVGSYPINVVGGSAANYKLSYIPGTLTIDKAEQYITWEQNLNGLRVGDQVKMKAESSSGLPVKYQIVNSSIAEVYSAGKGDYLDCIEEGDAQIIAIQEGNNNYCTSPRLRKSIVISNAPENIRGDLNGDGVVNMPDAMFIVNKMLKGKFPDEE